MTFRTISGKVPADHTKASRVNLVLNPTFRSRPGTTSEVRRNHVTNPAFRASSGTVEVRRNHCVNPSFEVDLSGWSVSGGFTAVRDTTTAAQGTASICLTRTSTATQTCVLQTSAIPVNANEWITYSFRYKTNRSATTAVCIIHFLDSSGSIISQPNVTLPNSSTASDWVTISATVLTPANTVNIRLHPTYSAVGAGVDGEKQWIDSVVIERGVQAVMPYFDGTTTAADGLTYAWTGTAHASASTATGNAVVNWASNATMKIWQGSDGASLRALILGSGANCYQANMMAAANGETWSHSVTVASDTSGALAHLRAFGYPASGGGWAIVVGSDVAITAPQRLAITAVNSDATTAGVRMGFFSSAAGNIFTLRQSQSEKAAAASTYFDGTTAATSDGITYSWTGAANASASVATGLAMQYWATARGVSVGATVDGCSVARVQAQGTSPNNVYLSYGPVGTSASPVVGGGKWTQGYDIKTVGKSQTVMHQVYEYAADGTLLTPVQNAPTVTTPANVWTRVSNTFTLKPETAYARVVPGFISSIAPHDVYYVKNVIGEVGATDASYFDGSTADDGTGSANRWNGTADASYSSRYPARAPSILDIDGVTWLSLTAVRGRTNYAWNPTGWRSTASTVEVRRNYWPNPFFVDTNADGIAETCASYQVSTPGGTYSVANSAQTFTHPGLPSGAVRFGIRCSSIPVVASSNQRMASIKYTISGPANTRLKFYIDPANGSGQLVAGTTVFTSSTASSGTLTLTIPADSNIAQVSCYVWLETTDNLGTATQVSATISQPLIEELALLRPFFGGSTAATPDGLTYSWAGAANASASVASGMRPSGWLSASNNMYAVPGQGCYCNPGQWTYASVTSGATAPQAGRYYAAACTLYGTPGSTVSMNSTDNIAGSWCENPTVTIPASGVITVNLKSNNLAASGNLMFGPSLSKTTPGVIMTRVQIEEVSGPGVGITGAYFDGSAPVGRTNLLKDPSSEAAAFLNNNAAVWAVSLDAAKSRRGVGSSTKSVTVAGNTSSTVLSVYASGPAFGSRSTLLNIPVGSGAVYTFSGYVYTDTPNRTATARITYWKSTTTSGGAVYVSDLNASPVALTPGQWTRVSLTGTVPVGADIIAALPMISVNAPSGTTPPVGEAAWTDDWVFEESATVGDYFDGSTPAASGKTYLWTGTANASTSVEANADFLYRWVGTADGTAALESP